MNNYDWYGWGLMLMIWGCSRWAYLVSTKVPDWIHQDWNHQATTFLAQKDTMMTPEIADDTVIGEPAPTYKWWTPRRAPHMRAGHHKFSWLPYLGPLLNKDYKGFWTELWVSVTCVIMLGSVFALTDTGAVKDLNIARGVGGILLFAWLQSMSNVDNKTQFLPDMMTIPLLWLGLTFTVFVPGLTNSLEAVQGALSGYLIYWLLSKAFLVLRKKEGMGGGDMKLAAAIGAWVGPAGIVMTIGLSAFIALAVALSLALRKKNFNKFAYGPSIATAGVIVYILQPFLLYGMVKFKDF